MTPYELRFEIFKQAYAMVQDEFSAEMELVSRYNEDTLEYSSKKEYPRYPSYRETVQIADRINTFVSEAKA
jgi:hypothetical protein